MKKRLLTISFMLASFLTYSQTKLYEVQTGEILTEEEYISAKASSLENAKKELGPDIELYEKLEISKETNNEIKYTFRWYFLDKEMFAEKLKEEKLIGQTLVDFDSLEFLNPKERNTIDKNNPTLVNFWFTSCPPCRGEIPALNVLKEKYKEKMNFVSITFDSKEKVEKFLRKNKFDFTHIVGEKDLIISLGISSYPTTFLVDKNKIIQSIEGPIPSIEDEMFYKAQMEIMENAIKKLL